MSKKSSGVGLIQFIQLGFQVGEKLVTAAIKVSIQCIKWLWQGATWSHREYLSLRGHSPANPLPAWERITAAAGILILTLLFLKFGIPFIFWILS